MSYNDATIVQANHIRNNVQAILNTNFDFFAKEVAEGRRANRQVLNIVARGIEAFRALPLDNLEKFSPKRLKQIDDATSGFVGVLRSSFDAVNTGDAGFVHRLNNIVDQLTRWEADYYDTIVDAGAILRSHNEIGLEWQSRIQAEVSSFRADVAEKKKEADALVQRMEALRSEVADSASKGKVSNQSDHFSIESSTHNTKAKHWLLTSAGLLVVVITAACAAPYAHEFLLETPGSTAEWIQLGISKAIIFSVLVYSLLASIRNYNANRHNAVVNKHRSNALSTYTTLAEAARDLDKRDIILTKAAECIFDPQPTGFTKESGSESSSPTLLNVNTGGIKPNVGG